MNNARTIHLQRLDGCSSYDRFAKNTPAIITPEKMPVPTVLSGVEQSHAPAGLGVLGRNLRTLRIGTNQPGETEAAISGNTLPCPMARDFRASVRISDFFSRILPCHATKSD